MTYGSVCSGIEAATVAWKPLGWKAAFFSEIEKFPRAVLKHHYPDVPLHGDFTTIKEKDYDSIDLLVGGTPCQSFSVAGLRKGMADDRGNLALEYLRLAQRLRPKWLVWENVPGVRSSWTDEATFAPSEESRALLRADGLDPDDFEEVEQTHDLDCFLAGLQELGYGFAMRSFDAQYFNLAQRRERVFVIGYLGDWRPAAAVLFERHGLSGDTAPSREKGEGFAATVTGGPPFSRTGNERVEAEAMVAHRMVAFGEYEDDETASAIKSRDYRDATDLVAIGIDEECNATIEGFGPSNPKEGAPCHPLAAGAHAPAVAFQSKASPSNSMNPSEVVPTLDKSKGEGTSVMYGMTVRRLTPRECERLQGFPDDYTCIPWNKKGEEDCPDGPRYKALGNSMAVPVMRYIGERIAAVEEVLKAT